MSFFFFFRYFDEAALEIYNCENVLITHSLFCSNRGTGSSQVPFRGNTGAVSIGYYNLVSDNDIVVDVINTTFINNSALANTTFRSTSHAFFNGILTGRAGGLGVFVHEDFSSVIVRVIDCVFQENYARSYGGGLYFVYSGNRTVQKAIGTLPVIKGHVSNCSFVRNIAGLGGGGFIVSIQTRGPIDAPHLLHFEDCLFDSNVGNYGGAFYYYVIFHGGRGNSLSLKNTVFRRNRGNASYSEFGSAFAASIYEQFNSKEGFPIHMMESWLVHD